MLLVWQLRTSTNASDLLQQHKKNLCNSDYHGGRLQQFTTLKK